jgi:hypothetical protein
VKHHPRWSTAKLGAYLRRLNQAYDGPGEVVIDRLGELRFDLEVAPRPWRYFETIPGDGAAFDHMAAARRLLAAWRDARGQLELFG